MATSDNLVLDHLDRWAEDLIDLSRRNRLLYFRHTRSSSFEFSQDAAAVGSGLSGRGWRFHLPEPPPDGPAEEPAPSPPASDELVVANTPTRYRREIERGLKNLRSRAEAEFLDAGIWVLYVGLGRLDWIDVDEREAQTPLLLAPVRLSQEGPEKRWRLNYSEEGEAALNPALSVKLERDFGITLPTLDDLEEADAEHTMAAVAEAVTGSQWKVQSVATLCTATFHKEVIYRDLRQNSALIAQHPAVRLLAEGPTSEVAAALEFSPEPEEDLDGKHPPEDLACILDVDATQRQCVIAARSGRSFVMAGPPGTGKSQTIANLVAQLIKDGRTVLFVSEKAAALEVVQRRLASRALDMFALSLHSQNATRKAFVQELARSLDERPKATSRFDATKREQLIRERSRLTAYAVAVNEIRQPLGRSLHQVAGRIAQLEGTPEVAVPNLVSGRLSASDFSSLRDSADQLSRAWGPVTSGASFLWRDLVEDGAGPGRERELRSRVEAAREAVRTLQVAADGVCEELRLTPRRGPAEARDLASLVGLIAERPPVGEAWLAAADTTEVDSSVRRIAGMLRRLDEVGQALSAVCDRWRELDPESGRRMSGVEARLGPRTQLTDLIDGMDADALELLGERLERASEVVRRMRPGATKLAAVFGVDAALTVGLARRLAELAGLAGSPVAPEPAWLDEGRLRRVQEARRVLTELLKEYRSSRDALSGIFLEDVLDLDLRSLRTRFHEVHKGVHKLGGSYRSDKRILAEATVAGKMSGAVLERLDDAIEWQECAQRLDEAEMRHASALGANYYPSRSGTDLDRLERAVRVAGRVLALADVDVSPAVLVARLARGADPDPRLAQGLDELAPALALLLDRVLVDLAEAVAAIDHLAIDDASTMCAGLATTVRELGSELRDMRATVGSELLVGEARSLASHRVEFEDLTAAVEAERKAHARELGELAPGTFSAEELEGAVAWVAKVRERLGGSVRRRTAGALTKTDLRPAVVDDPWLTYDKRARALFGEFVGSYGDELRSDCDESFSTALELIEGLLATTHDVEEWSTHVRSRTELVEAGLEATVADCESRRIPAELVGPTIERAILTRWAEEVMGGDDRLEPRRSVDRDEIRSAFRRLDRELVEDAAAAIVNECSARRPRSLLGAAGVIRKEGIKQRRHKPVRVLLEEAGEVAQLLKPCFMMSPLSVSQFLPPQMKFDVVIFDEASQVREADAICSIYRGGQLIVAGDEKQLPPSDFFSRITSGEEADDNEGFEFDEFKSVLDRCKAQGFKELPLLWHYRSQHEGLITFSNREFYEGSLHTFPGATYQSPDLGVELFVVPGQYRRGTTRDNPVEAAKVVERIVEHRRRHPEMTIGVVALSASQQACIEEEIERRQDSEPELRELVTDDRLAGFFVKNLENVQGDERDLIILSIGYGRDEFGKLTQNFGPMNRESGWQRLNVAVTRARRRVEVVSSIKTGDVRSDSRSTRALARYLDYAERDLPALATESGESAGDAESPFEEAVLAATRSMGYEAVPQVGVAGYRVDIGIRHPTEPGRYLLGVECDGYTYHSSKVARDRDRLRQAVLEGLGWKLHRIWSTAWFANRGHEIERLQTAIDAALADEGCMDGAKHAEPEPLNLEIEEFDFEEYPDWAYSHEAPRQPSRALSGGREFTEPGSRPIIAGQISELVSASGPIHCDVVLDLVRKSWGIGRASSLVREAFAAACRSAVARGDIERDGDFLSLPDQEIFVRVPAGPDRRTVAQVPPGELDLALVLLLRDAGPSDPVRLRTEWARLFGWRRVGSEIELAFDDAVDRLLAAGRIDGPDPLRVMGP